MPVQINEVIIRAVVGGSGSDAPSGQNCGPENTDGSQRTTSSAENELAEVILEILKSKNER